MEETSKSHNELLFGWADYLLFTSTLLMSLLIGVYHAWRGSNSTSEYLMGGKSMGIFPIAMSLAASSISGTTLLGTPADVYLTGTMYLWMPLAMFLCTPATGYLYLAMFHRLQVVSANQYLELRFNHIVRRIASFLYIVKQLFYMAIIVYAPSLALKQVTGINVYISVGVLLSVCTFYTALGGLKAVVWTDTLQIFVMYGSFITVLVKGSMDIGGLNTVWQRNFNSSRIEFFNIDFDPTTRHTIWSLVIGGFFYWTSFYGTDQSIVQRFLAMPTLPRAQISMWCNLVAAAGIVGLACFGGMIVYAKYFDCDPLSSKVIEKADQIMPLFVMDTVGSLPGLPGLFVAGVFSGALSSLSSGLNSVALIVLEDFIRPFFPLIEDQTATKITKGVAILFGCINFGMVLLVSQVQTILDATLSFNGAVNGATIGVFSLGMFVPQANSIGAGFGLLASFATMMWLGIGSQIAKSRGLSHNQLKLLRTDSCPLLNSTASAAISNGSMNEADSVFVLWKISYLWYTMIGMLIVLILGTIVSFLSGPQNPQKLDPKLLCKYSNCFRSSKKAGELPSDPKTDDIELE
ncbi:sodium-coupled monocarboxylate transporter 1-like [Daphnia pulicaria]|uniref:sodium-coupled monocarboxylate transporter 1-like n=1 Tax=Daphnia pulicaria TaxID=35523 RepID=UPI001EEB7B41|nr:sodium-coupled monocarboxylate transporter 1-like [Daphnia pulicaria]